MSTFETLTIEQQDLIKRHLQLVIEKNREINLTRIDTLKEGMILHVEDSLVALPEVNDSIEGLLGDLGSGAGYPGIPLAIATGRNSMLVDARQKKMVAVKDIIDELGIGDQVETFSGRAELLARTHRAQFSVLTARALAKLPVLMELASPLLKKNGRLICYKAQIDDEEIQHARAVQKTTGMKMISDRRLTLEDSYQRRIIVFERVGNPTVKLPRQEGMAQRSPLLS